MESSENYRHILKSQYSRRVWRERSTTLNTPFLLFEDQIYSNSAFRQICSLAKNHSEINVFSFHVTLPVALYLRNCFNYSCNCRFQKVSKLIYRLPRRWLPSRPVLRLCRLLHFNVLTSRGTGGPKKTIYLSLKLSDNNRFVITVFAFRKLYESLRQFKICCSCVFPDVKIIHSLNSNRVWFYFSAV